MSSSKEGLQTFCLDPPSCGFAKISMKGAYITGEKIKNEKQTHLPSLTELSKSRYLLMISALLTGCGMRVELWENERIVN